MVRAQVEAVPPEILDFLKKADPDKDAERFWAELRTWYQDPKTQAWYADWSGFLFVGLADFQGATFDGPTHFEGTTFSGDANFLSTRFAHDADFGGATFTRNVDFLGTTFSGYANFRNVTFTRPPYFTDVSFSGEADFEGATFADYATFRSAAFGGDANFRTVTFTGDANFEAAAFSRYANFVSIACTGGANFRTVIFTGDANFQGATFTGPANYGGVTFTRNADFEGAVFTGKASFVSATFTGPAYFTDATFSPFANFLSAIFKGNADFGGVTFTGDVNFRTVSFIGDANFEGGTIQGQADFSRSMVASNLVLTVVVSPLGLIRFSAVRGTRLPREHPPTVGPSIRFGPMSLANVQLHDLDPSAIRLRDAVDIDKLVISGGVRWPDRDQGYLIADEIDVEPKLKELKPQEVKSDVQEIERLYTALRKNHEDRNDRVGAHGWYWSEMEIGRRWGSRRLTRVARNFYKLTSHYGLSAARPLLALLAILVLACGFYVLPWTQFCVVRAGSCAGLSDDFRTVLVAAFFQPLPEGLRLQGVPAHVVWLVVRVFGAAMLVSIGVAFRNQVAR